MNLDWKTRLYIGLVILLGAGAALVALAGWTWQDPLRFLFYVTLSIATSQLKVRLPGVVGSLSVNFVFFLLAVVDLPLAQTLLVTISGALAQSLIGVAQRPALVQVVFNASCSAVCIMLAHRAYHSEWLSLHDATTPMLLFFATAVYYVTNTAMIAGVIALSIGKRVLRVWYDSFFWTGPQFLFAAALAIVVHATNKAVGWQFLFLVLPGLYLIYHSYNLYLGRLEAEKKHVSETAALHLRTIEALALAIGAKDATTYSHLSRIKVYTVEVARELGLGDDQIKALEAAALLHDIGKLGVPEYIINKPGKLTKEEFERMKVHPVVGAEILECVQFPYPVVPIVRSHHEKWDGTGYPDGLKGEDIPIGARILAAVDGLDAMASMRLYRPALPLNEALAKVVSESGKSYDPMVVEILSRRCMELEEMARAAASALPERLSLNARAERDKRPAVGVEPTSHTTSTGPRASGRPADFIASIASARQEFHTLHEMSRDLGHSLSLEETLSLLATRMKNLVPYDGIAIYHLDQNVLIPKFVAGVDSQLFSSLRIPAGEGISGYVVHNRKPVLNGTPSVECGYLGDRSKFSTLRSTLSVPLEVSGRIIGALTLYQRQAEAFTSDHLRILQTISFKASQTIDNALQHSRVERVAGTDQLTGLANAQSLYVHLHGELQKGDRADDAFVVLMIDLDGFKMVNDQFGHLQGNRVLQLIADGLRRLCRPGDFVARVGGDEFVAVLAGITAKGVEEKIRVLSAMIEEAGREVCGGQFILGSSTGEAFYPSDAKDVEGLLPVADQRMYEIKHRHRDADPRLKRAVSGKLIGDGPDAANPAPVLPLMNALQSAPATDPAPAPLSSIQH